MEEACSKLKEKGDEIHASQRMQISSVSINVNSLSVKRVRQYVHLDMRSFSEHLSRGGVDTVSEISTGFGSSVTSGIKDLLSGERSFVTR